MIRKLRAHIYLGPVEQPLGASKFFKFEPIIDYTNDAMMAPVEKVPEWVYDEQIVSMKNRFRGLQYCKGKVHEWGLKNFLAAAGGGYVFYHIPYSGSDTRLHCEPSGYGLTCDVVLSCVAFCGHVFVPEQTTLYIDNWYLDFLVPQYAVFA